MSGPKQSSFIPGVPLAKEADPNVQMAERLERRAYRCECGKVFVTTTNHFGKIYVGCNAVSRRDGHTFAVFDAGSHLFHLACQRPDLEINPKDKDDGSAEKL